jgi:4-hydroxy-tetrahydrodipicolinate synthase
MGARLDESASGVFIIAATPFADDGTLDLESTDRLIDAYLEADVAGITILGMMGEAPKLTPEEAREFAGHVLARVAERVPVVVGVSSPGLAALTGLAENVMDLGAAGVMVAPPPPLPTDERYEAYVELVCRRLGPGVPVVLQDYPLTTGVHLSVPAFQRLVDACPTIVVLKHEDWPGLGKITRIRHEAENGQQRRVAILVGNSALFYPLELARGADGAMTGFAFPEMLVEVHHLWQRGLHDAADDLYDAYLPLVRYEQQPGIGLAVRKEVLRRRGLLASAHVRAPSVHLTPEDHTDLDRLLGRLDRRLAASDFQRPRITA